MWVYIYANLPRYTPTENTLLYITNDWDITDYSQYSSNHSMNWWWTSAFETLSTWIKVASFSWDNVVYATRFAEWMWKTTFTMQIWMKNKINSSTVIVGWRDRNSSWPSTSDKWWMLFGAENDSAQYVSWGSTDWQWTTNWINTDTTNFYLFTATINWATVNIYKNATLVKTYTWSQNIKWWSNTWWKFYYWWFMWYEGSTFQWGWTQMYAWEIVVEDKVWTQAEITAYYNLIKGNYWLS